jgi:hypothetical protein
MLRGAPALEYTQRRPTRLAYSRIALGASVLIITLACDGSHAEQRPDARVLLLGYPPAPWHLAQAPTLHNTVLWLSHIVITHRFSQPGNDPYLRRGTWRPDPAPVDRSERAALDLATRIAEQAALDPDVFPDLARRYSDDQTTRDDGGSLGGVRATELPPKYLNALSVLTPGAVSAVIQSPWGFHIIRRGLVPADDVVSGARIVIRYAGTWPGRYRAGPERTRSEALVAARAIEEKVRAQPDAVPSLAQQYSDSFDALESGDLGAWSLRSAGPFPRELERLGQLPVGQVSRLLDTAFGFELLLRTPLEERAVYAASVLRLGISPERPANSPGSREAQLALAHSLRESISRDPTQFDVLRQRYCCTDAIRWTRGRGPIGLTALLDGLAVGQILTDPLESEDTFIIAKRLDPFTVTVDDNPPNFELPHASTVDIDYVLRDSNGHGLAAQTRALAASAHLGLAFPRVADRVRDTLTALATTFDEHPTIRDGALRVDAWHDARARLQQELDVGDFQSFSDLVETWACESLMTRPQEQ